MTRLVLVGGGHAHVEVLRELALAPAAADVTLVTQAPWLVYSGMVPGVVAGHYERPVHPAGYPATAESLLPPGVRHRIESLPPLRRSGESNELGDRLFALAIQNSNALALLNLFEHLRKMGFEFSDGQAFHKSIVYFS